ncbi:MAG: hypothetical protein Q4G43_04280 [Mobilicoccus sp.]|nr:hypothetical protein [Mobilicoccus sp.]
MPTEETPRAETAASAAAAALDRLRHACPDTGEDRTQRILDDALDLIEARLQQLAAS